MLIPVSLCVNSCNAVGSLAVILGADYFPYFVWWVFCFGLDYQLLFPEDGPHLLVSCGRELGGTE